MVLDDVSSSSRSNRRYKYDVFLSFRRTKTRNFTHKLYNALRRNGLKTCRKEEIGREKDMKQSLLQAIEESFCAIVVLSQSYATSRRCLDDLQKILHSMKELGLHVMPIFYGVDPDHVRYQTGSFEEAFKEHELEFAHDRSKVQGWRDALKEVGQLAGWSSLDRDETKIIASVVKWVRSKLDDKRPPPLDSKNEVVEDGPGDYNRMLDCYLSSETMWKGTEALEQVQIHTEDLHQDQRNKVGPFYVSIMVDEPDLWLIQYVFDEKLWETIFSSPRGLLYLMQSEFTTLRPRTHLDSQVIDVFVDILTETERREKSQPLNWYLPMIFSKAALNTGDVRFSLDLVYGNNIRDNYMSDLAYCEKIFIPVHVMKNSRGHYYLYVIHVKNEEVEIWDSLPDQFIDITERGQTTRKLLRAMDEFFKDVMFINFRWRMASNILLQHNVYDSGIFVINYMQQSETYVRKWSLFKFDSDEERLILALKLLKSDLNKKKNQLYENAVRKYSTQVKIEEDLELRGTKRKWVDTCKTISDVGRSAYKELDDFNDRVKRNNVGLKTGCLKGYILPTTNLVGEEFQSYTQKIWEWIMENEVSAIGIWGMGGSGKTALATHVHNKLVQESGDDFNHIIWVSMSQNDSSISKLQKDIARSINLDISDECDFRRISGKLLQESKRINKCVLFLDDVWDPIFLEEVGFPISNNGIKLILTTRSREVCQNMNCMKNIINVKPLADVDGWHLFNRTLGIHRIQSIGVEPIARAVAKQFEGLPLAIVTIARSMKGKEDIREWNHLLECFQDMDNGQYHMDKRVFPVLKSSYARLNNKLQSFFLYYALSAEGDVVDSYVQPLIRRFFYERWTDKAKSFEIQHDEGYTMLDELKQNSLLIENHGRRRMHTLLRIMAINIAKKNDEIIAKPGMNLIELPENGEWKENLQKVFLTESNVQKILDGTCPKCPKLSTLLLDCNYDLKWIPDDFFTNMAALKILDLSRTGIEHLPQSVSNLECLIALLLSGCEELSYIPSLEKLQRLIELDLSFTAITEASFGLELLVNLKYLNLACTDQLKMSSAAISKMTNLQSLRLMNWIPKSIDVRIQDLHGLRKLKVISVNFCDTEEFNAYVNSFLDKGSLLKSYCLSSATLFDPNSFVATLESCTLKRVVLCGIDLANRTVVLPEDINELIVSKCDHGTRSTCICHALSFCENNSDFPIIEWLQISECQKLEYLCCVSPTCLFCSSVQSIQRLSLIALKDLKQIVAPFAPSLDSPFLYLRDLQICRCSKMEILILSELLEMLQNVETISVESCESMVEIVEENDCSGNTCNCTIVLPKLRSVKLKGLPELTFVFRGTMLCPFLEYFHAYDCKKLCPPHIEIIEGDKLLMEIDTGYHWGCDNQDSKFDD